MTADLSGALRSVVQGLGGFAGRLECSVGDGLRVAGEQGDLAKALDGSLRLAVAGLPAEARVQVTADRESETCLVRVRSSVGLHLPPVIPLHALADRLGGGVSVGPDGFVARIRRA